MKQVVRSGICFLLLLSSQLSLSSAFGDEDEWISSHLVDDDSKRSPWSTGLAAHTLRVRSGYPSSFFHTLRVRKAAPSAYAHTLRIRKDGGMSGMGGLQGNHFALRIRRRPANPFQMTSHALRVRRGEDPAGGDEPSTVADGEMPTKVEQQQKREPAFSGNQIRYLRSGDLFKHALRVRKSSWWPEQPKLAAEDEDMDGEAFWNDFNDDESVGDRERKSIGQFAHVLRI